jgi:type II secretory pathway pseudopilin PulG
MRTALTTSAGEQGFTLVEALLALTLLGITVVPLLQLYSSSLGELLAAEERSVAVSLAEREMERVRALGSDEARLRATGAVCEPPVGQLPERVGAASWRTCRALDAQSDPLELRVDVFRVAEGRRGRPTGEPLFSLATLVEGRGL